MIDFEQQKKRYMHDPLFHHIVDVLYDQILLGQFTVDELRAAANFAGVKFEYEHCRPIMMPFRKDMMP